MGVTNTLREIRQANGWTQVDVASASGTTPKTVSRIEQGLVAAMQLRTLVQVAQACGVSTLDLIPGLGARPARPLLKPRGPGS